MIGKRELDSRLDHVSGGDLRFASIKNSIDWCGGDQKHRTEQGSQCDKILHAEIRLVRCDCTKGCLLVEI